MINAGADRIGTSAGVAIMKEFLAGAGDPARRDRRRDGPRKDFLALVRYDADGLVPCVVQDAAAARCSWWPTPTPRR